MAFKWLMETSCRFCKLNYSTAIIKVWPSRFRFSTVLYLKSWIYLSSALRSWSCDSARSRHLYRTDSLVFRSVESGPAQNNVDLKINYRGFWWKSLIVDSFCKGLWLYDGSSWGMACWPHSQTYASYSSIATHGSEYYLDSFQILDCMVSSSSSAGSDLKYSNDAHFSPQQMVHFSLIDPAQSWPSQHSPAWTGCSPRLGSFASLRLACRSGHRIPGWQSSHVSCSFDFWLFDLIRNLRIHELPYYLYQLWEKFEFFASY